MDTDERTHPAVDDAASLTAPETDASSTSASVVDSFDEAEVALHGFMAETGIQAVSSPRQGHSPPTASALDTVSNDDLMARYSELVEWRAHAIWRIEHHSNRVMYAERRAARTLGDAAAAAKESSVAAGERAARQQRDVRKAEDRLDEERATLRYWRATEKTLEQRLHVVNREVSLRIAQMPSQARAAGFGA